MIDVRAAGAFGAAHLLNGYVEAVNSLVQAAKARPRLWHHGPLHRHVLPGRRIAHASSFELPTLPDAGTANRPIAGTTLTLDHVFGICQTRPVAGEDSRR